MDIFYRARIKQIFRIQKKLKAVIVLLNGGSCLIIKGRVKSIELSVIFNSVWLMQKLLIIYNVSILSF